MNLALNDSSGARQRCRPWTPIITQQLRLRHLYQIIAYNLVNSNSTDGFHYTLHSTAMSAPFYTSEIVCNVNPKWAEIDLSDLPILACTGFVLRVWQSSEIRITWGIHLSGLVYLGNAPSDIRPDLFHPNTVIFHMRGGAFTSCKQLKSDLSRPLPCIDSLNLVSTEHETRVFRLARARAPVAEMRNSYTLAKLKQLQALQVGIRNRNLHVHAVRDKINARLNPAEPKHDAHAHHDDAAGHVRYEPQLLTMTHLNKMLQGEIMRSGCVTNETLFKDKPTRANRGEVAKIQKEIEVCRLKNKILQTERDRKSGELRARKARFNERCDENEERGSRLMEDYRRLSKEMEKLRERKRQYAHERDQLRQLGRKLQCRRRQLMAELLQVYPITSERERHLIAGVELPHSDVLVDSSEAGLAVSLGYCGHVLVMCASFLQIPLRYPIRYFGSRSVIEDHVSPYSDKHREFPLYSRGKDRILFNNAVYLLNKNIAQYLHALGFKPQPLAATLPNLLLLLQGKEQKRVAGDADSSAGSPPDEAVVGGRKAPPQPDGVRVDAQWLLRAHSPRRRQARNRHAPNPGLSQILAIPEAVLNKQMSGSAFLAYMRGDLSQLDQPSASNNSDSECSTKLANCDIEKQPSIEEGTEMLPNSATQHDDGEEEANENDAKRDERRERRRLSRSTGSFDDELAMRNSLEQAGSDPMINVSLDTANSQSDVLAGGAREPRRDKASQYEIQKWIDSGPNVVQSDENLFPDEYLGRAVEAPGERRGHAHLTLRTDALVQRKSFNLVKPKF